MSENSFQIFATTGRDDLASSEIDELYEEGSDIDRANNWKNWKDMEAENQAFYAPSYDETRVIDMIMPIKSNKIFPNF